MQEKYYGSCLCTQVRFVVEGFSEQAANCHCTMCRKFHGAAYGTLVAVRGLKWLSGEHMLSEYVANNGAARIFCKSCGSSIGFRSKSASIQDIELAIATLDDEIPVRIDAQIYTNYKVNWCRLEPEIPTFSEGREPD